MDTIRLYKADVAMKPWSRDANKKTTQSKEEAGVKLSLQFLLWAVVENNMKAIEMKYNREEPVSSGQQHIYICRTKQNVLDFFSFSLVNIWFSENGLGGGSGFDNVKVISDERQGPAQLYGHKQSKKKKIYKCFLKGLGTKTWCII